MQLRDEISEKVRDPKKMYKISYIVIFNVLLLGLIKKKVRGTLKCRSKVRLERRNEASPDYRPELHYTGLLFAPE